MNHLGGVLTACGEVMPQGRGGIKRRSCQWQREDSATHRIVAIPGAGLLRQKVRPRVANPGLTSEIRALRRK